MLSQDGVVPYPPGKVCADEEAPLQMQGWTLSVAEPDVIPK